MRIAIVGPSHPYKGGIAQHTTELARRLTQAGHDVRLISWKTQYPFFYPGSQFVPNDQPELPIYEETVRVLSWKNPATWWRLGRQLRAFDKIFLIWWVPTIQGPVYLNILRALVKRRQKVTVICHNVLPHEARIGDSVLARAVFARAGKIITHGSAQASLARNLTKSEVKVIGLPFIPQVVQPSRRNQSGQPYRRLLFFGFVRPYKGLDILLKALAEVLDVKLNIAGEFWGDVDSYHRLVAELKLGERVVINQSYVSSSDLPKLFTGVDALVLPYKQGTASWNVSLANSYGLPVIATTAGSLAKHVRNDTDGLLCKPDDVKSLAQAIRHFYEQGVAERLRAQVIMPDSEAQWHDYVAAVTED